MPHAQIHIASPFRHPMAWLRGVTLLSVLSFTSTVFAITVTDDTGSDVAISQPATRIISLAPHTTELLFEIGAGDKIVGAVDYSDYPDAAKNIERIGDAHRLDFERIIALQPDLIIAWGGGNRANDIERLQRFGIPVYVSQPKRLEDIANSLARLGKLTGNDTLARAVADGFRSEMNTLKPAHQGEPVRVFYQIWHSPLMTVNGDHVISEIIRRCGGVNIFADLPGLVPQISREAVLAADPHIIMTSAEDRDDDAWKTPWQSLPVISAVKTARLYTVSTGTISRPTSRILRGAREICRLLGP